MPYLFDRFFIFSYNKSVLVGMKKITKGLLYGAMLAMLFLRVPQATRADETAAPFFTLQAGVSNDLPSTEKEAKQMAKHGYVVLVVKMDSAGYRIWVGKFKTKEESLVAKKILAARGVTTLLKENEKGPFEYEKSYEFEKQITPSATTKNETKDKTTPVPENAVLQAGLYKTKPLADKYKERITNAGYFAYIVAVKKGKRVFYSVRVGASANLSNDELGKRIQSLKFNVEWVQ